MTYARPAVIGLGGTGQALAAAVLRGAPEALLVVTREAGREQLLREGLEVSGALAMRSEVRNAAASIAALDDFRPDLVFLATKTFHLARVVEDLAGLAWQGFDVVSCHNGLGPEDFVAERLGAQRVFRMSLNFGGIQNDQCRSTTTFFNPPNFLGSLDPERRSDAEAIARLLTDGGLSTEAVGDIKEMVWRKMVMKCTMASIGALTDSSIRENLRFPPTREVAFGCFREALAIAKAFGYDFGEAYLEKAVAYIEEVGAHKDSMCHDIAAKRSTEIEYLGGKIVEYGKQLGIPTPYFTVTTALVRALDEKHRAGA